MKINRIIALIGVIVMSLLLLGTWGCKKSQETDDLVVENIVDLEVEMFWWNRWTPIISYHLKYASIIPKCLEIDWGDGSQFERDCMFIDSKSSPSHEYKEGTYSIKIIDTDAGEVIWESEEFTTPNLNWNDG